MWVKILFLVFGLTLCAIKAEEECGSKGIICTSPTSFVICTKFNNKTVVVGKPVNCGENTGCHPTIGFFPCLKWSELPTTTTTPTTTTEKPLPPCNSYQIYPYYVGEEASCKQYRVCNVFFFIWQWQTHTCPSGTGFSSERLECVDYIDSETCTVIDVPSTTTERPKPECTEPGNHAFYDGDERNCKKYYECHWNWWWFELTEETCPEGTGFSEELSECVLNVSPNTCEIIDVSTTTTTTARPIPECPVVAKFPFYDGNTLNCRKYYECAWALWWIQLYERECPAGTAFSQELLSCVTNISPDTCEITEVVTTTVLEKLEKEIDVSATKKEEIA